MGWAISARREVEVSPKCGRKAEARGKGIVRKYENYLIMLKRLPEELKSIL